MAMANLNPLFAKVTAGPVLVPVDGWFALTADSGLKSELTVSGASDPDQHTSQGQLC